VNLFKNIFARIWALWALCSFIITFLLIIIPALCSNLYNNEIKGQRLFIKVSRIWMKVWLSLIGCPLRVYGTGNFKSNQQYIVVFNHNSMLDIPLSAPFVPGCNKTIGKDSFAKVPLFGLFYKRGAILVNRKSEGSRRKSYELMKKVLVTGMHMCIYPEGTRNRTPQMLKPFFDGAFRLSIETQKEIIPCIIVGTKKAMPIHKKFYLWPHKLSMHFLPAVSSENLTAKELNKKVFDTMLHACQQFNV